MQQSMGNSTLGDKDILQDMLMTEKFVATTCASTVTEAANPQVMQAAQQMQQECQNHVHQLFQQMQQRGWYTTKPATPGQ